VTGADRSTAARDQAVAAVEGPGAVELAEIWATVDLERTLAGLGLSPKASEVEEDAILGARVVLIPQPDGSRLAVAEPNTEGRLAATLARRGEGHVGRYDAVGDDLAKARLRAVDAGVALGRVEDGPFGASVLVLLGSVSDPLLILCNPAAVPSRP
jgi:hypothetical protein